MERADDRSHSRNHRRKGPFAGGGAHACSKRQPLYAGFSPFAAIQLTLALEEARGVEFPRRMLRRQSFSSLEFDRRLSGARGTKSGVIAEHGADADMLDAGPRRSEYPVMSVKSSPR